MSHHTPEERIKILDEWIKAEEETIAMTNKIAGATENDSIKLFMDIIRTDSAKHKRIQEYLKKAMAMQAPALSFDEIGEISGMINEHIELEQKTVDMGHQLAAEMRLPIIKELISYLLKDEEKHVELLRNLAAFKTFAQMNT
jgi:rubrerythrin